jgi:hypothetical protein
MRRQYVDFQRGRGWFRVWIVLALLWYSVVAFFWVTRFDFKREITVAGPAAFSTKEALQAHIVGLRESAAGPPCAPSTLKVDVYSYETRGSTSLDTIGREVERLRREQPEIADRRTRDMLGTRQLTPPRTVYRAGPGTCQDRHEFARTVRAAVLTFIVPFGAIVAAFLGFYLAVLGLAVAKFGIIGVGRLARWIGEGFEPKNPHPTTEIPNGAFRGTFIAEFWGDMKPVLKIAGIGLIVAWIVFSLSTGVRADATQAALGKALGGSAVLFIVWVVARAIQGHRRSD